MKKLATSEVLAAVNLLTIIVLCLPFVPVIHPVPVLSFARAGLVPLEHLSPSLTKKPRFEFGAFLLSLTENV
jgi:hypothetical protein